MRKLLFVLLICTAVACTKDTYKTLISKKWVIESVTVTPAMTLGGKTDTNYIALSGPENCVANLSLSFAADSTYVAGANGALCDMMADASVKTWKKDGNKIVLSASPSAPLSFDGKKLTQTTTTQQNGTTYTFLYTYKSK
ncbi:hypothetical protein EV200_103556 [Pedobacter psychrotolerans]|uniref:Lipocalin-like protein n=1 Tax=Pedobacter psychrotolerans TaxID=1843235 RepID=A0A4R2HFC7_9SPHI|nr:hypothetical protein [Pedobacter psychrotolerans]TCO27222.1 hypothetical protein EV200_103556 [Pedobacter psychrotolerans]GGE59911.1 hypothetical protein GCM10011413_27930 [Pedobacter psychrotolerans]